MMRKLPSSTGMHRTLGGLLGAFSLLPSAHAGTGDAEIVPTTLVSLNQKQETEYCSTPSGDTLVVSEDAAAYFQTCIVAAPGRPNGLRYKTIGAVKQEDLRLQFLQSRPLMLGFDDAGELNWTSTWSLEQRKVTSYLSVYKLDIKDKVIKRRLGLELPFVSKVTQTVEGEHCWLIRAKEWEGSRKNTFTIFDKQGKISPVADVDAARILFWDATGKQFILGVSKQGEAEGRFLAIDCQSKTQEVRPQLKRLLTEHYSYFNRYFASPASSILLISKLMNIDGRFTPQESIWIDMVKGEIVDSEDYQDRKKLRVYGFAASARHGLIAVVFENTVDIFKEGRVIESIRLSGNYGTGFDSGTDTQIAFLGGQAVLVVLTETELFTHKLER